MPQIDGFPPGTFCWADLATHDLPGLKKFYGDLLGWTFEDVSEPGRTYSVAKAGGRPVAGIVKRTTEPFMPQWLNYLATTDLDATVAKAEELGARVIVKPADVLGLGRAGYIQDPSLAVVGLWQAGSLKGAGIVGEPSAVCWNELRTRNLGAAEEFYTALNGWSANAQSMGPMDYTTFANGQVPVGGMVMMPREIPLFVPAHWLAYFMVSNADQIVEKANSIGGKLMGPVMDIPTVGRIAAIGDPAGTVFAVMQPAAR